MSNDIRDLFDEVDASIHALTNTRSHSREDELRKVELQLKYLEVIALKEINQNLYEISHFGIGTD